MLLFFSLIFSWLLSFHLKFAVLSRGGNVSHLRLVYTHTIYRRGEKKRMSIFLFIKLQVSYIYLEHGPLPPTEPPVVPSNRWERLLLHFFLFFVAWASACLRERVRERNIEKFEPHHSHSPDSIQPPYLCFILRGWCWIHFQSVHSLISNNTFYFLINFLWYAFNLQLIAFYS